jgi:hypothetical protein
MGEQSIEPDPAAPPQPLPLGYARREHNARLLAMARRGALALGAGLLTAGVGYAWARYRIEDAGKFMGWGAAIIVIAVPWGWRR